MIQLYVDVSVAARSSERARCDAILIANRRIGELVKLGAVKIILGTVPSGKAMGGLLDGVSVNGKLVVTAVFDTIN
jgi:hypothetical protein